MAAKYPPALSSAAGAMSNCRAPLASWAGPGGWPLPATVTMTWPPKPGGQIADIWSGSEGWREDARPGG
jgi:hypothetical protein